MAFISGVAIKKQEPLSRYLPQIPDGVISTWLSKNVSRGSWILDPFGASPRLIVEAARAGYRVLVTANNPIARFLTEVTANPPKIEDYKSAFAELAGSYKANERIEPHIRSLYNTRCVRCGQIVSAEAFLWEHGGSSPYARIYSCPSCGDSGEHPCVPFDTEVLSQFSSSGLHKARALERVVASSDQDRIHVEQALSVYIPRALYALITIINKIDALDISPTGRKCLSMLLLHAFDQGTAMWRYPGQRERRRQLTIPRQFRENNIWDALEQGIHLWSARILGDTGTSIPQSLWPEEPPESGGICIYEGRLLSISNEISKVNIQAVCTTIPRPNQAFWTLSALWAGWLWGREAVGSFKSVLHRQRYDWGWHTTALTTVFKVLANILDPSTPILGLLSEAEPGFIGSSLVAARIAGCNLRGISIRSEENQAQLLWNCQRNSEILPDRSSLTELGIIAAKKYLESRGEPTSYLNSISAALTNIVQSSSIRQEKPSSNIEVPDEPLILKTSEENEPTPTMVYSKVYNSAREALTYRSGFLQFNFQEISPTDPIVRNQPIQETMFPLEIEKIQSDETENIVGEYKDTESELISEKERLTRSSDVTESTFIWLRDKIEFSIPTITDRYEIALVDYLKSHDACTTDEIGSVMCELFRGLYTPDPEFIRICMESYGEKIMNEDPLWKFRQEDNPSMRQVDVENAKRSIYQLAKLLKVNYSDHDAGEKTTAITWMDISGELVYSFYPITTAVISDLVLLNEKSAKKGIIVLPGSRANLVIYKLHRDPRLSKAFNPNQGNWQFLKFRHLKSLTENPLVTRANFDQLLTLDPLTYSTPQLRLI
jgi:hypothetical protein